MDTEEYELETSFRMELDRVCVMTDAEQDYMECLELD